MTGSRLKPVVIDGNGHLSGRLAALVAKTLLNGQRVVVLRCERLILSGLFFRKKLKYLSFLRKRCNVNPARGPFHERAPSRIFKRTVRGMLPMKITRGKNALAKLKCYEGIPRKYERTLRKVVPEALRMLRLAPGRRYCTMGRLSHEVGWKYQAIVKTLEARRIARAAVYTKKKAKAREEKKVVAKRMGRFIKPLNEVISSYGYK